MKDRKQHLIEMRPDIPSALLTDRMGAEEFFQNKTLRPVIKLQRELLIEAFKNYTRKHKNAFLKLSIEKRLLYIENAIQKDIKFRNSLKGMIIGMFTVEEYVLYTENSSALNKRMMKLVKNSLQDNIQLLESDMVCEQT
ncbi:glyoxalase [Salinimicrobium sp. GXAS 041]|uniref:glyoxalase n=1 Tax=Salinimicrobium sp. GXAS 041 TaxID=3400806 RepID=UPI003C760119